MLRVLGLLITAAIVLGLAWFAAGLPGHVGAEIGPYSINAATPIVALGLLALFVILYVLIRFLAGLINLPRRMRLGAARRRADRGERAITATLLAIAAGEGGDARREATRARRNLGDTPQTLLLTAEASRLAGSEEEAEAAFTALAARPDAAFLGLRGLLRQAMEREDWVAAVALAKRAEAAHPGARWLRAERAELAIRTDAWSDALSLTDPNAPTAPVLATAAAQAETDPAKAMRLAKQAFKDRPDLVSAALTYARLLRAAGREGRAQETIRAAWSRNPHPDLAAFAFASESDALARAKIAKRIAQENPNHVESHMMVARASLDAGLWGEARHALAAAEALGARQRRLYLMLADVEEHERGETDAGRIAQRDALRAAAAADPDPVWQCSACFAHVGEWRPVCPNCGKLGTIGWGVGRTRTALPVPVGGQIARETITAEPALMPPAHDPAAAQERG
jgi:HemY protein